MFQVGSLAGDPEAPWPSWMKIHIDELGRNLLDCALRGGVIMPTMCGHRSGGSPVSATVLPTSRKLVER